MKGPYLEYGQCIFTRALCARLAPARVRKAINATVALLASQNWVELL